ncbi:DM13 domain-containing protein [Calothrix sp. PCC 7507]|uniref:DM13 domain-containing protein n=1 Tax=Calothrix sp. PCC 7507 TaxID=99598 RepID=UPI00029EC54C|nr:DM13 domain-containing protein [Calothrix sp. PCC 7507]AFY30944.1 Electron transfer DM13 [Calothrix sp. PCC 7507]
MRFQHLVILGITAIVSVSCAKQTISNQQETPAPSTKSIASPVADGGTFKAGEHPIRGKVSITNKKGKRYLEFDRNFKTSDGPDVYVILYRSHTPPTYGIKEKDYVSLSRLQKTSGTQSYVLPENVKLGDFKSVAIWCRKFNATFGYASL